jgi:lipopolysaccharide/colanic/teichoic acid biosynthesis glycosyltransferase
MKRVIDLAVAVPASVVSFPLVVVLVILASLDTRRPGLFRQRRVGRNGELFTIYKVRTMRPSLDASTVTVEGDQRITRFGSSLRRLKLDELPQLWNVAAGSMSLVGPRPDVEGYADQLVGADRAMLSVRPGITGPATLLLRDEEGLLCRFEDPIEANSNLLWPLKVAVNCSYTANRSIADDARLVLWTLRSNPQGLDDMLVRWGVGHAVDTVAGWRT